MRARQSIPVNLVYGVGAGLVVAAAASRVAPEHKQPFYSAAVQVVPVFLVALALERSLAETLGLRRASSQSSLTAWSASGHRHRRRLAGITALV